MTRLNLIIYKTNLNNKLQWTLTFEPPVLIILLFNTTWIEQRNTMTFHDMKEATAFLRRRTQSACKHLFIGNLEQTLDSEVITVHELQNKCINWASLWENRSSGFPTRSDINRAVQPHKTASELKFRT